MPKADLSSVPPWLASYDAFAAHVRDQVAERPPIHQGSAFSAMAAVLLPSTEAGFGFIDIEQSPKQSHDEGIDALSGTDGEGRRLVIQAKMSLGDKGKLDSILSYFYQFENPRDEGDFALFGKHEILGERRLSRFVIVTLSNPQYVVANYEKSSLNTRAFYDQLKAEGRLAIVDGNALWEAARAEFYRSYVPPSSLSLSSPKGWLEEGNVRVGVVPAPQLVDLYRQYGDGLFFENIRSFLGLDRNVDRETVNRRILSTAREAPQEFLARNNGITLRASHVEQESATSVELSAPSIVNGCQTTMCLVEAAGQSLESAYVTVKIVESADAWEVTHSANYQNRVRQIDLDLARFLRPQLVERVASARGLPLERSGGAIQSLVGEIATTRVAYDDVKYIYRGLFSMHPNDLFDNNYNKLRSDVLDAFHSDEDKAEWLFERIFDLSLAGSGCLASEKELYDAEEYRPFERFEKPSYKSYLTLIAASAVVGDNLDIDQPDAVARAEFLEHFLRRAAASLGADDGQFPRAFHYSYQALVDLGLDAIENEVGDARVAQRLHYMVSDAPFVRLHRKVVMRLSGDRNSRQGSPTRH